MKTNKLYHGQSEAVKKDAERETSISFHEYLDYPVKLTSYGNDKFIIEYGAEKHPCNSYAETAEQLGACIMHSAICAGTIKVD